MTKLTRDLDSPEGVPYFLWSENTTVGELRDILSSPDSPDRALYIARLLREAKVSDIWKFLLKVWRKRGAVQ